MAAIEDIVSQLKLKLDASTDSELARKLGVDRRTVSGWRSRGSVPKRYLAVLDGVSKNAFSAPPEIWGEYERVAFRLALMRFGNVYHDKFADIDYRTLLADFPMCAAAFWLLMTEAQRDIAKAMDSGASNLEIAYAMIVHDELSDVSAAVKRDSDRLKFSKSEPE